MFHYQSCSDVAVLLPHTGLNPYGLGCFPFARHYLGNHCCFLFLRLLRCFSSAGSLLLGRCHAFSMTGCPIRISADHFVFANPRSFSQLVTSFFALESQGILHTPLVTSSLEFLILVTLVSGLINCRLINPFVSRLTGSLTTIACQSLLFLTIMSMYFCVESQRLVENRGVEPLTPCVQNRCSGQLS